MGLLWNVVGHLVTIAMRALWHLMSSGWVGYWLPSICGAAVGWFAHGKYPTMKRLLVTLRDGLAGVTIAFALVFVFEFSVAFLHFWNPPEMAIALPAPPTASWVAITPKRLTTRKPVDRLLGDSEEMQRELCTFFYTWQQRTMPIRKQYLQDIANGMPQKTAIALFHARLDDQSREMRMVYDQTYKAKALELRGYLMQRIHDLGEEGNVADYSLEVNGITAQYGGKDDIGFARLDMGTVCQNFSSLVESYRKAQATMPPE